MASGSTGVPQDGSAGDPARGCAGLAGQAPAWCRTGVRVGPRLRDTCSLKGCAQRQSRSHCPLAQLLGMVPGAAAASSETIPATVISAMSAPACRKISGSHHSHPAGRAESVWAAPGARRVHVPHCRVMSLPWDAQPWAPTPPPAVASPPPKLHPHERGSPGCPAAPAKETGPCLAALASNGRHSCAAPEVPWLERARQI